MDVLTGAEGLYHVLVTAEACHDAKLHLTVVGAEEVLSFLGQEAAAYLLAVLRAHWYILQVRVA